MQQCSTDKPDSKVEGHDMNFQCLLKDEEQGETENKQKKIT